MKVCPNCGEENPERFRLCGFCGAELDPAARTPETRKTVTIVFSDLKGSTDIGERLDPESVRELMTRYFERMKAVLERHGGSVEKYIGDAIMAVFGLPLVREDDALRAVRAAAEMRRSLERLNDELERTWGVRLFQRIGVNTGEVVAGDPAAGQRLVVGDAVNVAARLEQSASDMEILLGDLTYRLVRDVVEVKPVAVPIELKGKAEPVNPYRLLAVRGGDGAGGRPDTAMVGRDSELNVLTSELARAVEEGACRMVTVLGEPGVGKSRLAREFAAAVGGESLVLRGRCLPYGRGITFWPLVEAVREAAAIDDYDTAELARGKIATAVGRDEEITARVAAAVGLSQAQFPVSELLWGARRLFETLAGTRPLALLFEDVHWAETTFLDLIEHVVETARSAPILIVCLARQELLEIREGWGQAGDSALVRLEALSEADAGLVVDNLLGAVGIAADARSRIVEAADGNPLFVEQLLSMLIEEGRLRRDNGRWLPAGDLASIAVPPSLDALLAARLDGLPSSERTVLEAASVIGQIFQREAVEELVAADGDGRDGVEASLAGLVRKQLVRPDQAAFASEQGFRFQHILVRDAAYRGLLKRARATLHQRFVDWADRVNRERVRESEYEEILGYHLEQAYRYLSELGPLDEHGREVGARAAERLGTTGRRAFARGDMPAAANLLRRAVTLLPDDSLERLTLLPDLGEAFMAIAEFAWAETFLDEAIGQAERTGRSGLAASARLLRVRVRSHSAAPEDSTAQVVEEAERGLPLLEAAADHVELARALRMVAWAQGTACRYGEAAAAAQQAMEHASLGRDERQRQHAASQYAIAALYGPTPVTEAIERCESIVIEAPGDRRTQGLVTSLLSGLRAMHGEFDTARDLYTRARLMLEELGRSVVAASTSQQSCRVEMLAGDPAAAERELRRDFAELSEMGERYFLSTAAGELAQAVYAQGRYAEAEELTREAEELSAEDDLTSQALWRSGRAKTLARRGLGAEAEELAREAFELLEGTDALILQADALEDLAEVLALAETDGARECLEDALDLLERKGDVVSAERVRASLRALDPTTA
jgi:class 3 adenylate cyclase/tetratricopeptide (TPR) repeat protein